MSEIRTRFAPSPTGLLHIGTFRTTLFNFLFTKKNEGKFVLRIEDTDRERLVGGAIENIIESLAWAGLKFDEGPIKQSDRLDIYKKYAEELVEKKLAYYCNCTEERLEGLKKEAAAHGFAYKYDRHCVKNPVLERARSAIRFLIPAAVSISFTDIIRDKIEVKSEVLEDFVIIKKDGYPTYNFANVIDDSRMKITHVIRGDEFVSSTPKHVLLYQALGFNPPEFAHVPQVLGKDKAKLSKRHGAKSVLEYRDEGYLPGALLNFLALLGWHPKDDRELFNLSELVQVFDLSSVQKSPAVFDSEKLLWFNGQYLKKLEAKELLVWAQQARPEQKDNPKLAGIAELLKERARTYAEFKSASEYFFEAPKIDKDELTKAFTADPAADLLKRINSFSDEEIINIEPKIKEVAAELGHKAGDVFMIVRIALTGSRVSPPLVESIEILGTDEVRKRLETAYKALAK